MYLPYLIFWILMLIIVPALSFMILRIVLKKPPYQFKMIFRSPGVDEHITVYGDKLDFEQEIEKKKYAIKAERLYRVKPGLWMRIFNKFRGVKESFVIIYLHNKKTALAPVTVHASARIIYEVSQSRALNKAFSSEFSVPWDLKKILMVIGFLVVAVIIYVVISGDVII